MKRYASMITALMFICSATAMSHDYGKVRLSSNGKIEHEGDFVVYDLNFKASCYTEENNAITNVSENVWNLVAWLDDRAVSYEHGNIEYNVDLINTWTDQNPYVNTHYYDNNNERERNPCYRTYSTTQNVSIKVLRNANSESIASETVQDFYNELYEHLWPLNYLEDEEVNAYSQAKISSVSKGVFDSTLEQMKEQAYTAATERAQRGFLAILGSDYHGRWFLNSADFSNDRYNSRVMKNIDYVGGGAEASLPLPPGEEIPMVPTIIKLDPLSYSVEGTFEYGFTHEFHDRSI